MIDNYDSFTYNLVQYFGELGEDPLVVRNDAITLDAIAALAPDAIVLGPGPGTPSEAGITIPVIKDGMLYVQAGAGIVHDSVPESEWQETLNKARAILRAADMVQQGLDAEA